MKTYDYILFNHGPHLWGHALGREVRAGIEAVLDNMHDGEVLKIECKRVQLMDYSFIAGLFGTLYGAWSTTYPGRAMVLSNVDEVPRTNLNVGLDALDLLAITVKGVRTWDVVGKVSDTDRETLKALAARKQA